MGFSINRINKKTASLAVIFLLVATFPFILFLTTREPTGTTERPLLQFASFDPEEKLTLLDSDKSLQIGKALEYLPDPENALNQNEVLGGKYEFSPLWQEGKTTRVFPYYDGLGQDVKAVWVRFTIERVFDSTPVLLTTPFNSTIVTSYIPDDAGIYRATHSRIEDNWRLFSHDPEIYIQLPKTISAGTPVYLKMEARYNKRINLDVSVLSYNRYTNQFSQLYHTQGIFLGFFLAILMFHIFLYITTREIKYFYYILFMFFLMINRMIATHIALWKCWAGLFFLENLIDSFILAGVQIFGLHFIRKTLIERYQTGKILRLNRFTNHLYAGYLMWAAISGIANLPFLYKHYAAIIMVAIDAFIVFRYIALALAAGNRIAFLYLAAFAPFFFFELLHSLANPVYQHIQTLIPYLPLKYHVDFYQCSLLAFAVGKDILRYKSEKEISERKLRDRLLNENKYLEKEVERQTADLKDAITRAEYANTAKSRFLANISHELRTPLGGIIGFAELINNTNDWKMQRQYNRKILIESRHLLHLISDVLHLSRIESGNYEIDLSPFKLKEAVENSLAGQIMLIREKGLFFELEMGEDLPEVVTGDLQRLRQVLLNLTNNAQKFTHKGSVRVVVSSDSCLIDNSMLVRFEIQDTGVGIPRDNEEKIFQPFYQVDHKAFRNQVGTGLGTTISQELVELMGGEIGYKPNPIGGSIFWFTVPFSISSRDQLQEEDIREPIPGSGLILMVDDYQTNREITSTYLESLGYTTITAADGYEAISLCSKTRFDLLLMDIHMPMLNGYETVEKITWKCPLNEEVPVLMLTAGGFEDETNDRIKENIKGIIYKPVQLIDISRQVASILHPELAVGKKPLPGPQSHVARVKNFLEQFEEKEEGIAIIREFINHSQYELAGREKLLRKEDFVSLHRLLHSIKGGSLNIGFQNLAVTTGNLEKKIKDLDFYKNGISPNELDYLKKQLILIEEILIQTGIPELTPLSEG